MGIKREVVERYYSSNGVEHKDVQSALRAQYEIDVVSCLRDHAVSKLEEEDYIGITAAIDDLYKLQTDLEREISDAPPVTGVLTDEDLVK